MIAARRRRRDIRHSRTGDPHQIFSCHRPSHKPHPRCLTNYYTVSAFYQSRILKSRKMEYLKTANHRGHSVVESQPKNSTQITQIKQIYTDYLISLSV